ncbi:uncharacterized protein LOC108664496 [Hyalella azteca]|uniref:Uncharacterized protein LOC108664496 n=1 Tax=Hyalella azteca TaxID=294128 RepID=A0A8B7MZ42_HYAAZ|nr:uncharacterized protein LOC108664496 [Hyalella azteca]
MGVKGLPSFIREHARASLVSHKLSRCRVIIDGKNLMFHLFGKCSKQKMAYGGDYDEFAAEVDLFFNSLLRCGIESCVLLDGGVAMKLASVKWAVHLLKSGIKTCAEAMPGNCKDLVYPPLLRQLFITRVRSHGITILQSDSSADNDIITLCNAFSLPVLSGDSDFCVHGLAYVDLRKLQYNKPIADEENPDQFYLNCCIFDKLKFCDVMDIHPDHITLLATLGMRPSLTRFKLSQFVYNISRGVKRDHSVNTSTRNMMAVRHWLSLNKDKTVPQIIEMVIDLLPQYQEMRHSLRTALQRILLVSVTSSYLMPWFTSGPEDLPCGHAAYTSSCTPDSDNLTTPELIDQIKRKKKKFSAYTVFQASFLGEFKRRDQSCPHAETAATFAGGLPLPRWLVISIRLCLLDFDAAEILVKKTLFSLPMVESVTRESACSIAVPIVKTMIAISDKTYFEYEKEYLEEQLRFLEGTPGEESADLAEMLRCNLTERKLNYFAYKKNIWKLRRNIATKNKELKPVASCSTSVSQLAQRIEELKIQREGTPSEKLLCNNSPEIKVKKGRLSKDSSRDETGPMSAIDTSHISPPVSSCSLPEEQAVPDVVSSINENISSFDITSDESSSLPVECNKDEGSHSSVSEILNSSLTSFKSIDIGDELVNTSNFDAVKSPDLRNVTSEFEGELSKRRDSDSDCSFYSAVQEDIQHNIDIDACNNLTQNLHASDDPSFFAEPGSDFDFSYFESNLQDAPLSELMDTRYDIDDESELQEKISATADDNLLTSLRISTIEFGTSVIYDGIPDTDSDDDDVLIEDDEDPSIVYKPVINDHTSTANENFLNMETSAINGVQKENEDTSVVDESTFHDDPEEDSVEAEIVDREEMLQLLQEIQELENFNTCENSEEILNPSDITTGVEELNPIHHNTSGNSPSRLAFGHSIPSDAVVSAANIASSRLSQLQKDNLITASSVVSEVTPKHEGTSSPAKKRPSIQSMSKAENDTNENDAFSSDSDFIVMYTTKDGFTLRLKKKLSSPLEMKYRDLFEGTLKKYRRHIDKVEQYEKEDKLVDGYRERILEKMTNYLRKKMLPILEKEANDNMESVLSVRLDGDYENAMLYSSNATSDLLPYIKRSLSFFCRKSTMKSVQVMRLQNENSLSQVPSILSLHLKCNAERKEMFCEFINMNFNHVKRLPNDIQFVIICVCYWHKNSRQAVTHFHLYAILLSLVMFFFVEQKIGRIRWDEKLKEMVRVESKKTNKAAKLIANAKDYMKNICYIASHLDTYSCAVAAAGLARYHQIDPAVDAKSFQRHFIHCMSEFQCCYGTLASLNGLLGSPFSVPTMDRVLNNTFAYNAFRDLTSCKDPGVVLAERLGPGKQMTYALDALHSCVADIILMPNVLNLFPKIVKSVDSRGKKVSQLVNNVDLQTKLRKEQMRLKERNELSAIDALVKEFDLMDSKKTPLVPTKENSRARKLPKQSLNKRRK